MEARGMDASVVVDPQAPTETGLEWEKARNELGVCKCEEELQRTTRAGLLL